MEIKRAGIHFYYDEEDESEAVLLAEQLDPSGMHIQAPTTPTQFTGIKDITVDLPEGDWAPLNFYGLDLLLPSDAMRAAVNDGLLKDLGRTPWQLTGLRGVLRPALQGIGEKLPNVDILNLAVNPNLDWVGLALHVRETELLTREPYFQAPSGIVGSGFGARVSPDDLGQLRSTEAMQDRVQHLIASTPLQHPTMERSESVETTPSDFHEILRKPFGGDPGEVACHVAAAMPNVPAPRVRTRVEVRLSREPIEPESAAPFDSHEISVPEDAELTVEVLARRNIRLIGESDAVVPVPKPDEPIDLVFPVEGEAEGQGELWVEIRYGPRKLATLALQPVFGSQTSVRTLGAGREQDPDPPLVELRITERRDAGGTHLSFALSSRDLGVRLFDSEMTLQRDAADYIDDIYRRLGDDYGSNSADFARFMRGIENLGAELYNQLVPADVRQLLWQHRSDVGSIEVLSDSPHTPWELARLTDPETERLVANESRFLAQMGLVRWLPDHGYAPADLRLRSGRARSVIPIYPDGSGLELPMAEQEAALVADLLQAEPVPADSRDVLTALSEPGAADLWHFCCHGKAEGARIWNAHLQMAGRASADGYISDVLTAQDVALRTHLAGEGDARPIVFLNACHLARSGELITGTGGMSEAFVRSGAGLLVSALWAVDDARAHDFGAAFYQALLAGATVTSATRVARATARSAQDPTWLAYVVYGHPYARLAASDRRLVAAG